MTRLIVAACSSVLFLSATAFAQTPPAVTAPAPAALRMAFVDLQRVAAESTEGKAANAKVQQLTQTKANDISAKTKQLDAANQKMQQGGAVLNDAARATLQKDVLWAGMGQMVELWAREKWNDVQTMTAEAK